MIALRILYILGATENKSEVDHYMASCCFTKPAPHMVSGESKRLQAPKKRKLKTHKIGNLQALGQ